MTDYQAIKEQLGYISEDVDDAITILANASALLYENMKDLNWCGFYLWKDGILKLGPFQGKYACTKIEKGKGVCGTSILKEETILVKDVHKFAGHIACDSASNSEIVVPIFILGHIYGVLDIDSPLLARFNEDDKNGLEDIVKELERILEKI